MENRYLRVLGLINGNDNAEKQRQLTLDKLRKGEINPQYKTVNQNYEDVGGIPYERTFPPRP